MSFAVETIPAVTVTSVPQPTAGSTVDSGTVAVSDPASSTNPVTVGGTATVALATEGAGVVLTGNARVTVGTDASGNALGIGGSTIDARGANGVVVSLAGGNAGSAFVDRSRLPSDSPEGSFNTFTKLSDGTDEFLGSEFSDLIELGTGNDVVVGGGGDDAFLMTNSLKGSKKKLTLDGSGGNAGADGSDIVTMTSGALKKDSAKVIISDFNYKSDTIQLETKRNRIRGFGTDTLKISTKNGKTIKIVSDGTRFKRSSIEFI